MRKKHNERVYIGDIVVTTKRFRPVDAKNKFVKLDGDLYRGIVVSKLGDDYGIRFGKGLEFTDHLKGLLSKPVGCFLKRDEFEIEQDL